MLPLALLSLLTLAAAGPRVTLTTHRRSDGGIAIDASVPTIATEPLQ